MAEHPPTTRPDDLDRALQLAQRLNRLPEPAMRGAVLAERLQDLPFPEAAGVVATIVARGRRGGPPFELALAGLEELLRTERLPYAYLVELYRQLKERGLEELALLLLPGRQPRNILGDEPPDLNLGREVTLGERKSLARAAPRDIIDRLAMDTEPMVIRLLLANPRVVERDVVRIAARRPIPPEVVREIMGNARWIARYAVKHTIVLNPACPEEMAIRLLPSLTQPDLENASRDPALPAPRVAAARELMVQRADQARAEKDNRTV